MRRLGKVILLVALLYKFGVLQRLADPKTREKLKKVALIALFVRKIRVLGLVMTYVHMAHTNPAQLDIEVERLIGSLYREASEGS